LRINNLYLYSYFVGWAVFGIEAYMLYKGIVAPIPDCAELTTFKIITPIKIINK